jgi:hypothetical protein
MSGEGVEDGFSGSWILERMVRSWGVSDVDVDVDVDVEGILKLSQESDLR